MAEGWIDIDDIEGLQHFNTDLPFFPHPDHDTLTAEQIIDSDREVSMFYIEFYIKLTFIRLIHVQSLLKTSHMSITSLPRHIRTTYM